MSNKAPSVEAFDNELEGSVLSDIEEKEASRGDLASGSKAVALLKRIADN